MVSAFAAGFVGGLGKIADEKRKNKREDEKYNQELERLKEEKLDERTYQRKLRMEEFQQKKKLALMEILAERGSSYGGSSSGSSGGNSDTEIEAYGQALVQMGGDKEQVSRLMATGDVENLGKLVTELGAARAKYQESNFGDEFTPEFVNSYLQSSVSVDSETMTISVGDVMEDLGISTSDIEFEDDELAIMGDGATVTRPGAIVAPPIAGPNKKYSPSDRAAIQEDFLQASVDKARIELDGYSRMINDLAQGGSLFEDLGGEESAGVRLLREIASDRAVMIGKALEMAEKGTSYRDLVDIYAVEANQDLMDYYRIEEGNVPMIGLEGGGTNKLVLPPVQKDIFQHILSKYGITNYTFEEG